MITVGELAILVKGTAFGELTKKIVAPNKIEDANENEISFLSNPKYSKYLNNCNAGVLLVDDEQAIGHFSGSYIRVKNVYTSFAIILSYFESKLNQPIGEEQPNYKGTDVVLGENLYIGAFTYIGKNSKIGNNVKIYPQTYIGDNVEIGEGTILFAGVKIYANCNIGKNCIIHSGAIIGADGFGFAPQKDNTFKKIPQLGKVIIEDNVEIGANSTIDCGTMGATVIRNGVKIDNQVQVGHNVEIGEHTVIAAQSGISGSTKIGHNCVIGGQVGFVGHIEIAPFTQINAKSGVSKSVLESGQKLNGSPAFGFTESYRAYAFYKKLPEMAQKLKDLEDFISLQNKP